MSIHLAHSLDPIAHQCSLITIQILMMTLRLHRDLTLEILVLIEAPWVGQVIESSYLIEPSHLAERDCLRRVTLLFNKMSTNSMGSKTTNLM